MVADVDNNAVRRLTEQYNVEARAYADYWAPVVHPVACGLLEELPAHTVNRALDLGAGAGLLLPVLHEMYREALVVGVDRSEGLLELAHPYASVAVRKYSMTGEDAALGTWEPLLAVGDAASLGLRDNSFDLVVMAFMLYHLPDPSVALTEAMRVLEPGGVLGITTWAGDMESPVVDIWNEELDASGAVSPESLGRVAQHELMDSPEKVEALLEAAGFVAIRAAVREFAHRTEPDDFIKLRTKVGSTRQRFESLDGESRHRLIGRARKRYSRLSPDDWALRLPVVFATATAGN